MVRREAVSQLGPLVCLLLLVPLVLVKGISVVRVICSRLREQRRDARLLTGRAGEGFSSNWFSDIMGTESDTPHDEGYI